MKRIEPPPLAVWMLEHCTPVDRDEALAGDLLEDFHSGRAGAWYWRQVLQACAIGWLSHLRARVPLLVFTLLWSMLSPAWKALVDRIQDSQFVASIWRIRDLGPLQALGILAIWMALNAAFLWAGMLIFLLAQSSMAKVFRGRGRAFLTALLVFVPAYGVMFVLASLYWYSFFANASMASTAPGQIADLRLLADVIRVPYFFAVLIGLWGVAPRPARAHRSFIADPSAKESSGQVESLAPLPLPDPFTLRRFFCMMGCAGLINAMIVGFVLCRLPDQHSPTFSSLLIRAVIYVGVGAIAGVAGTRMYWVSPASPFREHPPMPFSLFALICSAAWVWVPAMMLFSEQVSGAAAMVAIFGAILLAMGLRKATYTVFVPAQQPSHVESEKAELFTESLYRAPFEAHGYLIAICLYAAVCALADSLNLTAAALLALSAFLFAWKRTFGPSSGFDRKREFKRAALLLLCATGPAVLATIWALMDGVAHRNHEAQISVALAAANVPAPESRRNGRSANGLGGYESLILWPAPRKKQLIPPLPADRSFLAKGSKRPLIIRFDGAYWYMQAPDKRPGPAAHQAHGTPLGADIESNNLVPLVMDAHQVLGSAIPVARCGEIQVEIANRDNRAGAIRMAVLLTDGASAGKQTLYLGQQPIVSTEPGHFAAKTAPANETLRFSLPQDTRMRKFNEITVMLLPDVEHTFVGPKIAIEQFDLLPR